MYSRLNFDTATLIKLQDRNSRFQNLCIFLKFFQKLSSQLWSWIFSICFGCFLLTDTTEKNALSYRSFTKPYPCNIDRFKTKGLWPIPVTFESKWDLKPSRLRLKLAKMVSRPSLKTSSLQIIQQSSRIKKVVKFIDLQKLLSFCGPTIFHGCPYARRAWYKQFNSNAIFPNFNLM